MRQLELTFSKVADQYLAVRIVSRHYAANVRRIADRAGVVSVGSLNDYIKRRAQERSGTTVKGERVVLLSLYKWAYESHLVDDAPRGVTTVKSKKAPTKAWTVAQLKQLLDAAAKLNGKHLRSGADLGAFLRCWVLVAYETGARLGDVMAFTKDSVSGDTLSWTQAKTGDPMVRTLTPKCQEAIAVMLAASFDGTILGWVCGRRMALRHMRTLIDSVGIGGSGKWLRRSGATHCEMERAGAGRLHLGHRSPALFEQAYADWAQLRTRTPRTPALVD